MNIQKLIAIVAAIAINCAVLAWFHAWTSNVVASAAPSAAMEKVVRLPTIHVHPSADQWRAVRHAPALPSEANVGGAGVACLVMPYYSFAAPCDAPVSG